MKIMKNPVSPLDVFLHDLEKSLEACNKIIKEDLSKGKVLKVEFFRGYTLAIELSIKRVKKLKEVYYYE